MSDTTHHDWHAQWLYEAAGEWFFETADCTFKGPYTTREEAIIALDKYCDNLE